VILSALAQERKGFLPTKIAQVWRILTDYYSFLTGARTLETYAYKPGSYPFDLIAPITIIWKPTCAVPDPSLKSGHQEAAEGTTKSPMDKKRKGKGKVPNANHSVQSPQEGPDAQRTVWIRSHPAIFDEVFDALRTSASLTLDALRRAANGDKDKVVDIELADLRGRVNTFEIMGPKSDQVIKGALTPVAEDKREEFKKVCKF
jgi:ribonuclease P/MRP protein subunit POP1